MDTPDPQRMTPRKKFDAFEQGITGGHHIGHLPVYVLEIEGWTFRRCRCGFSLALTPSGAIWWLRTTKDAMEIKSFKSLLRALNSNCWAHPRPEPVKDAVISPPAIAQIAAEPPNPPASDTAISTATIGTASRPASLETQSEPKAKSNEVPAPMPRVEKPPPAKQRRTYVTPRAQCMCGKIHLVDDNFPKPVQERTLFCNLRWLSIQRAIVIGIDALEAPIARPGARRHESGHGTSVHAEIRRWRRADFAAVGLMTTCPEKGADPASATHALAVSRSRLAVASRPRQGRGFKLPQLRHGNVGIRGVSALGRPLGGPRQI